MPIYLTSIRITSKRVLLAEKLLKLYMTHISVYYFISLPAFLNNINITEKVAGKIYTTTSLCVHINNHYSEKTQEIIMFL